MSHERDRGSDRSSHSDHAANLVAKIMGGQDPGRGQHMVLVLQFEWLDSAKNVLTPKEAVLKEAVWQWFSSLDRAALERVRTATTRATAASDVPPSAGRRRCARGPPFFI